MKLKRFLLRYDPAGIGIECQTSDGDINTTHIDVPEHVQTMADIEQFARETIEQSPIFKEGKHLKALVQILARLRRIEVGDEDDNDAAPGFSINVKDTVVIIGLRDKEKDEGRVQLNGEISEVTKAKPEKDKYEVTTLSGKEITVKSKNLVPMKDGNLVAGAHVLLRGLRNHVELNGCFGRVVECQPQAHRYEVRATESGQLFRVKEDNLVLIDPDCPQVRAAMAKAGPLKTLAKEKENHDPHANIKVKEDDGDSDTFKPGTIVRLRGLKTAQNFNGQTAEILGVDAVRSRYEIRLADNSVKTVRAENVEKA